jgi:aryl-phospho-beta-D-glucosidase BglC (GH1 family)
MRNIDFFNLIVWVLHIASFSSCESETGPDPVLTVSEKSISFAAEGGSADVVVECNDQWTVSNPGSAWLQTSLAAGGAGTTTLQLTAHINNTGASRKATIEVNSSNGQSRRITVSQVSLIYPSYNTSPLPPDVSGMSSNAMELAAKMNLGWNLGNTFEAPGGETGWGSPVITEDFIKFVKQTGFNAIRIPCAWDWYHVDNTSTARIDQAWLNRVKEVVGYCVDNDMYVLLNIHWDGGWLENNCTPDKKDSVNAKQKAYWEQIATAMRDFDEHLMFASANEPNADDATEMEVLLSYHQTFVDAVRSTGGRNTYRVLVIQGAAELLDVSKFPTDPTPNRMMYESHNYTPAQFCFLSEDVSWGNMAYYWGKDHQSVIEPARNFTAEWGNEEAQLNGFKQLKQQFIDKGIPVLLGEYGAYRRSTPLDMATHHDAVDYWITYVTKLSRERGIVPFWWDTGGALNRSNNTVKDQRTIDAIKEGAK